MSNTYSYDKTLTPMKLYNIPKIENTNINNKICDLRKAADIHKQVRKELREKLKPNMKVIDICNFVENRIVELSTKNDLTAGVGFPCGVSINNIAAHDSAIPNDNRTIKKNDVIKIDFGVHVNGNIIDSAFTHTFDDKYSKLLEATKDATMTTIKTMGPDALIPELSQNIKEIIESYEITLNNKTYKINAVSGIGGHNILPYQIHAGKIILCNPQYPDNCKNMRMNTNELYAIETFASTGKGFIKDSDNPITHYSLNRNNQKPKQKFTFSCTNDVYNWIINNRSTLPFASRWVYDKLYSKIGEKYKIGLNELIKKDIVQTYPALEDVNNTYTSQLEHTIYLHDYGKEILSQDCDY